MCERCGLMFIANAPHTKYCDSCKLIVTRNKSRERAGIYADQKRLYKLQKRTEKVMGKYKGNLEQTITECKEKGITYAEQQKAKTLAMIPKIEV